MAKLEIIIAKLPALIADRTDSLKLETAIRYVGDIIFQPESVNQAWGVRAGSFSYINEFGVKLEVPRFKVIDARSPISSLVSFDSTTRGREQPRT